MSIGWQRVTLTALCLVSLLAPFAAVSAAPLTPEQIQAIDKLVATYRTAHQVPGLSIAVVSQGQLVWSQGYGLADVENEIAAKATTVYRTAAIGKTMTATAAMQLVEAGKLQLDVDMRQYCPAFPAKPYIITTRHLLSHLSGIRHEEQSYGYDVLGCVIRARLECHSCATCKSTCGSRHTCDRRATTIRPR